MSYIFYIKKIFKRIKVPHIVFLYINHTCPFLAVQRQLIYS